MALKRNETYPGRFDNPTTAHPQGAFKNRTAPTAQDGSYLEAAWANDWDGFFARIINVAGITLNGTADTGSASQLYDALLSIVLGTSIQASAGNLIVPTFVGGVKKNTIIQWGPWGNDATGDSTVVFPYPFPNNARQLFVSALATGTGAYAGWNTLTKTGFKGNMWSTTTVRQSGNSTYLAIGD